MANIIINIIILKNIILNHNKMCLPMGAEDEGRDLMGNLVPPN